MSRILFILTALLWCESVYPSLKDDATATDSVRISLLTCMPGREIYELDGHSALRVVTETGDSIWNYGLFSFNQPNFVYRFVKGETDYMVGAYPTLFFLPEYEERGSEVYEQVLNLTPEEKKKLITLLHQDLKPENKVYRYNYIKDNCATRIRDHVEESVGGIIYTDTLHYGTYRSQMRSNHANYPWYQFGIDLALGPGLDGEIDSRQEMFTPLEMNRRLEYAKKTNGDPIVVSTEVLVEGSDHAIDPPTPWWQTPMAVGWLLFVGIFFAALFIRQRHRPVKWIYSLYFGVAGVAGCVITFLMFISTHEATGNNILLLWLNPLQLIPALCVWIKRGKGAVILMMIYNVICPSIMLLLWPTGRQSLNPAILPYVLSGILLAACWLIYCRNTEVKSVIPRRRTSSRRIK